MGICNSSNDRSSRIDRKIKSKDTIDYENMISQNAYKELSKSLCKITIQSENSDFFGIGFFMYIELFNKTKKCLLTNYNNISQEIIDSKGEIIMQLGNEKIISISLDNTERFIKYLELPLNITIIEILNMDIFDNDIDFLYCDSNYIKGYKQYLNQNILSLHQSLNGNEDFTIGKIIDINEYGFKSTFDFIDDYTGFPIILLENKKIIGIYEKKNCNNGIFIGEIINELEKEENKREKEREEILKEIDKKKIKKEKNREKEEDSQLNCLENEIIIKYKINEDDKFIKLFGSNFVDNNKNNCKLIINNEEKELCEYLDVKSSVNKKETNIFELKLKLINTFTDISFMFSSCKNMIEISNIFNLDTSNVTKINNLFFGCTSLSFIPDLSDWDTSNVINMGDLFSGCTLITSLPDISNWDTSNVTNMSYMFSGCELLSFLPDISKWNTYNVNNFSYMFHWCKSLSILPDLSLWDTNNATDMSWMFSECSALCDLPNITNWKTNNVTDMNHMFYGCSSLKSLPDISIWDTSKVTDMSHMFHGCVEIETFPDFMNWNTESLKNKKQIFKNCKNLSSISFKYFN